MLILDSDILIHVSNGTEQVIDRLQTAEDEVCTTVINQIELLQARYDYVLKAANGEELLRAQEWLDRTIMLLERFPAISIDRFSAAQFDSLRSQRKLRKIGRADMLMRQHRAGA